MKFKMKELFKLKMKTRHQQFMNRVKISFLALLSTMIAFSYIPALADANLHFPGKVYYVSTTGSDSNEGSLELPWRTIQYAADQLKAGETVLVRGGTYEESITIKSSGSASAGYITFQAYPGEQPIIDGSNLSDSSSLVHLTGAHYIVFDGFELTGLTADSSSKYLAGIKLTKSASNIHILNNYVYNIANYHDNGNANGIIVYGDGSQAMSNITIMNNTLHDLVLGSSETLTVVGNVDGFNVSHNLIYNVNNIGIDIAGHYGTCSSPCTDQARNGVVSDNVVYNVDTITNPAYRGYRAAAAIYVDGGTNTIIERNEVSYSNYGIEIASEKQNRATSNIVVRNNYIHDNHQSGLIMGGSSSSNGSASNNVIMNNTFYNNNNLRTGDGEITFQNYVVNNAFINNIFYTNSDTPFIYDSRTSNSGNVMDYNLYYVDGTINGHWRAGSTKYSSFEKYVAATKRDVHSLYGDPLFTNLSGGDISLSARSPAIEAGTTTYGSGGEFDYFDNIRTEGKTVDIGAVEYGSVVQETKPPSSTPEPTLVPGPEPTPIITSTPTITPTPVLTPTPIVVGGDIVIDGVTDDWKNKLQLASSTSNVKELKAYIENDILFVLVTGDLLSQKGQLYIYTDGALGTPFAVPHWSNHSASYLLENGTLYQYTGTGKTWSWSKVASYTKNNAAIYSSAVELAIPLSTISSSAESVIKIGYIWKDSTENKLPLGGEMINVGASPPIVTPTPTVAPTPTPTSTMAPTPTPTVKPTPSPTIAPTPTVKPTPTPPILIDGKVTDWSKISASATSSGNVKSVKMTNDSSYLYVLIEGTKLSGKDQIFFNSDNDAKSGYQTSKWTSSGMDYLLENGILYQYTGNGKTWSFSKIVSLDSKKEYLSSASVIEIAIPLSELSVSKDSTIKFGVILDDSSSKKLPSTGDLAKYTLK